MFFKLVGSSELVSTCSYFVMFLTVIQIMLQLVFQFRTCSYLKTDRNMVEMLSR